jgi:hypothetical protein
MKASSEQVAAVRLAVSGLDTVERRARYLAGDIPRAKTVRDLSKRYRWDLYYLAVDGGAISYDTLRGLNDAHVDTVLRAVVPALP